MSSNGIVSRRIEREKQLGLALCAAYQLLEGYRKHPKSSPEHLSDTRGLWESVDLAATCQVELLRRPRNRITAP